MYHFYIGFGWVLVDLLLAGLRSILSGLRLHIVSTYMYIPSRKVCTFLQLLTTCCNVMDIYYILCNAIVNVSTYLQQLPTGYGCELQLA